MSALQQQYHNELKKEVDGEFSSISSATKKQSAEDTVEREDGQTDELQQVEKDAGAMSRLVMSRKKRGLLEAIEVILLTLLCPFFY